MIQAVSDHRSNRNDQIRTAVDVLGRSKDRLKVFKAIYRGKKALKTVPEIALGTGLSTYIPHIWRRLSANFHRYSGGRYADCGMPRRLST